MFSGRVKIGFLVLAGFASEALSQPYTLNYSGRLTQSTGKPLAGPVDLEFKFFRGAQGGIPVGVSPVVFQDVQLVNGMFLVEMGLSRVEYNVVFNGLQDVWVEVKDLRSDTTYPRQRFNAVPYALKIPIDENTLAFDADGRLTLSAPPEDGKFLSAIDGQLQWITLSGGGDMAAGTYDSNGDGKVNAADNADRLGGQLPSYYLNPANLSTNATHRFTTDGEKANWNAAYGWGNHASAGYLTGSSAVNAANLTGTIDEARLPAGIARTTDLPSDTDEVAEGSTNQYFSIARARSSVSASTPLQYNAATGVFSIPAANNATNGYLSSFDWTVFSGKQDAIGSSSDVTMNNLVAKGSVTLEDDDASAGVTIKAHDATDASYTLSLPAAAPTVNGQLLSVDASGQLSWVTPSGGGDMMSGTYDTNANGKVDIAENAEQLGGVAAASYLTTSSTLNATSVTSGAMSPARITQDASNRFTTDAEKANWNAAFGWGNHASAGYLNSSSGLSASNITSGTLAPARVGTDANHRFVTDAQISSWNSAVGWGDHASAGYLNSASSLNASNITSGTLLPSLIGTDANNRFVTDAQIASWTSAVGWGNHASAGYLTGSSTLNATNMTTGSLSPARITQDASNRFTTDAEKANWNAAHGWGNHASAGYLTGSSTLNATNMTTGAMSPARITQDTSNRFVTDTEKTNWNTAHADRLKWDGGATGLNATTGRASLGLGTMATQNAASVSISGGTLTSVTLTTPVIADDAISGNKIHGGVISNFASTGIDDNAAALAMTIDASGRVGVGTASPDTTAVLDVSSTTQGFLPPRMTTAQRNAIANPVAGLTLYNTTTAKLNVYDGTAWEDYSPGNPDLIWVVDEKPSGTNGGNSSSGSWQVRTLNTVLQDNGSNVVSLAGNVLTLKAGTYECDVRAPMRSSGAMIIRLWNTTANEMIMRSNTYDSAAVVAYAEMEVQFTLEVDSGLRIDQYSVSSQTTTGLGQAAGISGITERYSSILCKRLQ